MNIRSFIIHLDRAHGRKEQVRLIQQACPVESEVVPAFDGRSLPASGAGAYSPRLFRPHYPFRLRDTEIAAFLSHRLCWKRIVAEGLDAALILEDDVAIDEKVFGPAFALASRTLEPDDIIRFPVWNREQPAGIVRQDGRLRVFLPKIVGLGMQGLLVGRNAAAMLLDRTEKIDRPVDSFVQMTWITGVRTLAVMPSGLREVSDSLGGSLIGESKSLVETIHREIMRPVYRFAIARRARLP